PRRCRRHRLLLPGRPRGLRAPRGVRDAAGHGRRGGGYSAVSAAGVHDELELKAVIPDPGALRPRLLAAGAVLRFTGRMSDRRYAGPGGELGSRAQVLRLRTFHPAEGHATAILGWKGPVERSLEGYKRRAEIELPVTGGERGAPHALLSALGYEVVHAIDREV